MPPRRPFLSRRDLASLGPFVIFPELGKARVDRMPLCVSPHPLCFVCFLDSILSHAPRAEYIHMLISENRKGKMLT